MSCIVVLYYALASMYSICRSTSWLRCFGPVIISLYARSRCESLCDLKGKTRMALKEQRYAITRYWFPLQERIGNIPGSSVYSLLMCFMWMWSSLYGSLGGPTVGVMVWLLSNLGFVDRNLCLDWTRWPMMVLSEDVHYLAALAYVSSVQED